MRLDMKKDCCDFPDLKRPNYFFGQMLGVRELLGEQNYFREKMKLLNRTLHGWGVVCGLDVSPSPSDESCEPAHEETRKQLQKRIAAASKAHEKALAEGNTQAADQAAQELERLRLELEQLPAENCDPKPSPTLRIDCGLALDCEGNELLLHRPKELDPLRYLSKQQRESEEPVTLYVAICYCAKPIEPSRPLQTQDCGITSECEYGWTLDTVRFDLTLTPPREEENCNRCCKSCDEQSTDCDEHDKHKKNHTCCCLVLAAIDDFVPGQPIEPSQIRNGVRRMLSVYDFVRISGISWAHGGVYSPAEAKEVLGAAGNYDNDDDYDEDDDALRGALEIHLTRPIRTSTLQPGVLDIWVIEGGGGRSADINHLAGDFILPASDYTKVIRFQQRSNESLQDGDLVLIMLRCEFVLDQCCRAIDGAHIGGKVPQLPDTVVPSMGRRSDECPQPSWYPPPWRSGSGTEGSNFVSWFFVATEQKEKKSKKEARYAQ
jgi:hypothetical protein